MQYDYSYSGADANAFAWFDGVEERIVFLDSLHTISYSVNERKSLVRSLGYRNPVGATRSIRTIAGSMIFVVVQDHPLRGLIEASTASPLSRKLGWSIDRDIVGVGRALNRFDFTNRLPTLLPPFNLLTRYVSEMAAYEETNLGNIGSVAPEGAAVLLRGVEFIDDGLVTSVNDIVSEITLSFIAMDIKTLSKNYFYAENPSGPSPWDPLAMEQEKQAKLAQSLSRYNAYNYPGRPGSKPPVVTWSSDGQTIPWDSFSEDEQRLFQSQFGLIGQ